MDPNHQRKRPRRPSAAARLPDDVLEEIFHRLPAKSVLRFRAVSTSWRRLLSDPAFLRARHHRAPRAALLVHPPVGLVDALYALPLDRLAETLADDVIAAGATPLHCGGHPAVRLHGCCDGLLLLSLRSPGQQRPRETTTKSFFVCNPATREVAALPTAGLDGFDVVGFYLHASTAEYRVLFCRTRTTVVQRSPPRPGVLRTLAARFSVDRTYAVAAAGKPTARLLGRPNDDVYLTSELSWHHPPVTLRGCLHWNARTGRRLLTVLVFDTAAEEFRTMRGPCNYFQGAEWTGQLIGVQGTMAASSYDAADEGVVALWLLQDYDEEAWACVYRVDAGFLGDVAGTMGFFVAHVSDDGGGDALLRSSQGQRFGVYNLKRGEVVAAGRELGGDDVLATQHVYQESFASPVPRRGFGGGAPSPRGELATGVGEASSSS